jgi:hypothetical protein
MGYCPLLIAVYCLSLAIVSVSTYILISRMLFSLSLSFFSCLQQTMASTATDAPSTSTPAVAATPATSEATATATPVAAAAATPSIPLTPPEPTAEQLKKEADIRALPEPTTLLEYALRVLITHHTNDKVALTQRALHRWHEEKLPLGDLETTPLPADRPARPSHLIIVPPAQVPKPIPNDHLGNRLRLIHSLAHIESYAIDLAWDIMVRYIRQGVRGNESFRMPREFFDDWFSLHLSFSPSSRCFISLCI